MSQIIQVHRPVVETPPAEPVALAPRAAVTPGARLVLIDNGKPRARHLLLLLGEELRAQLSLGVVELVSKSSAASPLEDDHVRELAGRFDLAVTGLGDCGACSACSLQDALLFERFGTPATVLITDVFISHVARFSGNLGAPGYHHLVVPHPVATKSDGQLQQLAASVSDAARTQLCDGVLAVVG